MGLNCNKMLSSSKSPASLDQTDSWARSGGYVFRPVFRNELNEVVYEKSQLSYSISWRKIMNLLGKRNSFSEFNLINKDFYLKFKDSIRGGIPDRIARDILVRLFGIIPSDLYWRTLKDSFEGSIPDNFLTVPTFSSLTNLESVIPKLYINSTGINALKRTLWALHKLNESINYCPQLPGLVSLLLIYLNEEEVFYICDKLLKHGNGLYLIQQKSKFIEFVDEIVNFIIKEIPALSKMRIGLSKVISDMIRKMFIGYFRVNCLLRLMLAYLTEGLALLGKFIIVVFLHMNNLNFISSSDFFVESLKLFTFSLQEIDALVLKSFKVQIFEDEIVENRHLSERSSCLSCSNVLTHRGVRDLLEKASLGHKNDAEVVFSKDNPEFGEILGIIEGFPRKTCIICLFITTSFEVFGFFLENVMRKNLDNPDSSIIMVFELEPEQRIFMTKDSGLVQVSPKGIRLGGSKPALFLTEDKKLFINSTEEFGDFALNENEYKISIVEIISIS